MKINSSIQHFSRLVKQFYDFTPKEQTWFRLFADILCYADCGWDNDGNIQYVVTPFAEFVEDFAEKNDYKDVKQYEKDDVCEDDEFESKQYEDIYVFFTYI